MKPNKKSVLHEAIVMMFQFNESFREAAHRYRQRAREAMAHAVHDSSRTHELSVSMKFRDSHLNAAEHMASLEKELLRSAGIEAEDYLRERQC